MSYTIMQLGKRPTDRDTIFQLECGLTSLLDRLLYWYGRYFKHVGHEAHARENMVGFEFVVFADIQRRNQTRWVDGFLFLSFSCILCEFIYSVAWRTNAMQWFLLMHFLAGWSPRWWHVRVHSWMLMLMALACRKHMGYVCAQVVCLWMRGINLWMRKNSPRLPGFCMGAVKKSIWAVFFFLIFFFLGPCPMGLDSCNQIGILTRIQEIQERKKKKNR